MPNTGSKAVRVIRWVLVVPAALAVGVASVSLPVWWTPIEHQNLLGSAGGLLGAVVAVYVGSRIAPARHREAAIATAAVLFLITAWMALEISEWEFLYVAGPWTLGILAGLLFGFRRASADLRPRAVEPGAEDTGRRYKGMTPFQDRAIDRRTFFGRDRESRSLLSLVLAERLVVLFAKSGMGKTSLLNAGLAEPLRAMGYFPMTVRLADPEQGPVHAVFEGIRQAAKDAGVDCAGGDDASLWRFFKTAEFWSASQDLLRPVLILDQFEELFTLHAPEGRRELIAALAELMRGRSVGRGGEPAQGEGLDPGPPDLKIVLSLREDFLADLEELSRDIPGILHHRFRLGPLTRDGARAAIVEPAGLEEEAFETAPFTYSEAAVEQILGFLARRRHGAGAVESDEVEPVQLQLLCQYLEEKVRARTDEGSGELEITEGDVGGERHMQRVLEGFYDRTLLAIWPPREARRVRRLCEKRLISAGGRRLTEAEEEIERKYKVSKQRLRQLVDARLLRSEPRLGGAFYELSHDTLVEPIRQSRRKRLLRWQWILRSVGALLTLAVLGWWIVSGEREYRERQKLATIDRLVKGGTDPTALASAKLDEIEESHPEWVGSRRLYGAMAFALADVARQFPELSRRARRLEDAVRESFNRKHGLTRPELDPADWAEVPAGSFEMGSPEDEAGRDSDERLHRVELSSFRILRHEVTNAEYRRFDPSQKGPHDHPAVGVNWYEAFAYAAWLGGRLPTEAEWEYAARAATTTRYWSGDDEEDLARVGWYSGNSNELQPVRRKPANPWGLYDVHGNAWEWVIDWYGPYPSGMQVDPWGPPGGVDRVVRGGGFRGVARWARAAYRIRLDPGFEDDVLGFRVVLPGAPSP